MLRGVCHDPLVRNPQHDHEILSGEVVKPLVRVLVVDRDQEIAERKNPEHAAEDFHLEPGII